jgi:hypothetical protein
MGETPIKSPTQRQLLRFPAEHLGRDPSGYRFRRVTRKVPVR